MEGNSIKLNKFIFYSNKYHKILWCIYSINMLILITEIKHQHYIIFTLALYLYNFLKIKVLKC